MEKLTSKIDPSLSILTQEIEIVRKAVAEHHLSESIGIETTDYIQRKTAILQIFGKEIKPDSIPGVIISEGSITIFPEKVEEQILKDKAQEARSSSSIAA